MHITYVCIYIYRQCEAHASVNAAQLRFARMLKPLRWLKLVRIIKLNRLATYIHPCTCTHIHMHTHMHRCAS